MFIGVESKCIKYQEYVIYWIGILYSHIFNLIVKCFNLKKNIYIYINFTRIYKQAELIKKLVNEK